SRRSTASRTSRRTSSSSTIRIRISLGPILLARRQSTRQGDREFGSLARSAADADLAVVRIHDTPADGETETRSTLSPLRGHERVEDSIEHLGRDAFAVVADPYGDAFLPLL